MIKINFDINDAALEIDIAQALVNGGNLFATVEDFMKDKVKNCVEELRGTMKRTLINNLQKFVEITDPTKPQDVADVAEVFQLVENKLVGKIPPTP